MSREVHVRVCEGLGVKVPRATRLSNDAHNQWGVFFAHLGHELVSFVNI